jgi:hypothetical protein
MCPPITIILPEVPGAMPMATPLEVVVPPAFVMGITRVSVHPAAARTDTAYASARRSADDPIGRGPISPARVTTWRYALSPENGVVTPAAAGAHAKSIAHATSVKSAIGDSGQRRGGAGRPD